MFQAEPAPPQKVSWKDKKFEFFLWVFFSYGGGLSVPSFIRPGISGDSPGRV